MKTRNAVTPSASISVSRSVMRWRLVIGFAGLQG